MAVMWIIECDFDHWYIHMMRFYAPFITEATLQVTMALRSERAMVGRRQKYRGGASPLINAVES